MLLGRGSDLVFSSIVFEREGCLMMMKNVCHYSVPLFLFLGFFFHFLLRGTMVILFVVQCLLPQNAC